MQKGEPTESKTQGHCLSGQSLSMLCNEPAVLPGLTAQQVRMLSSHNSRPALVL